MINTLPIVVGCLFPNPWSAKWIFKRQAWSLWSITAYNLPVNSRGSNQSHCNWDKQLLVGWKNKIYGDAIGVTVDHIRGGWDSLVAFAHDRDALNRNAYYKKQPTRQGNRELQFHQLWQSLASETPFSQGRQACLEFKEVLSMKALSWNVHGLGSSVKWVSIKEVIRISKVDLLLLLETKLSSMSDLIVKELCGNILCD